LVSSSSSSSSSSSIYNSTAKVVIEEMINECQRNIDEQYNNNSLVANEYLKHKMKTLQNAPRDLKKLERLLKTKEKECEKAKYALDIESLVAEIEVLRVIRYLINRNDDNDNRRTITTNYPK
jgi:phage host-nuclease inhibitor protein Gam